jgi:hypothetical protein
MGWFDHDDYIRCDPDHRQNRGNGPVTRRQMTPEEREKYRFVQPYKRPPAYIIDDYTVDKMLRHRGLRV